MSRDGSWRRSFFAWEDRTAQLLEALLRRPRLLEPAARALSGVARARRDADRALEAWLASVGLASRTEHERLAHQLNELESRLYDLEEALWAQRDRRT